MSSSSFSDRRKKQQQPSRPSLPPLRLSSTPPPTIVDVESAVGRTEKDAALLKHTLSIAGRSCAPHNCAEVKGMLCQDRWCGAYNRLSRLSASLDEMRRYMDHKMRHLANCADTRWINRYLKPALSIPTNTSSSWVVHSSRKTTDMNHVTFDACGDMRGIAVPYAGLEPFLSCVVNFSDEDCAKFFVYFITEPRSGGDSLLLRRRRRSWSDPGGGGSAAGGQNNDNNNNNATFINDYRVEFTLGRWDHPLFEDDWYHYRTLKDRLTPYSSLSPRPIHCGSSSSQQQQQQHDDGNNALPPPLPTNGDELYHWLHRWFHKLRVIAALFFYYTSQNNSPWSQKCARYGLHRQLLPLFSVDVSVWTRFLTEAGLGPWWCPETPGLDAILQRDCGKVWELMRPPPPGGGGGGASSSSSSSSGDTFTTTTDDSLLSR